MTDHAIEQIPEPTPAEARALAVLDRRGWSAAASLTAAVSAHVEPAKVDREGGPAEPVPPRTCVPVGADDVPLVVDLSAGRTRRSQASARPWWLAAAAVAAVVGLVAVVTSQDEGRSVMSSGGGEVAPPVGSGDGGATARPLEDGQTEVAAGEHEGEPWRLLATRRPGYAALELAYGNGSSGTGWNTGSPGPLEVLQSQSGDWPSSAVFGVVSEGATVTIEVPGGSPVIPELVALAGWDHQGFVVFLADLDMPDLDAAEVVVVARGPDGQEIARDSQPVIAPLAVEAGPPPAVPEEGAPG